MHPTSFFHSFLTRLILIFIVIFCMNLNVFAADDITQDEVKRYLRNTYHAIDAIGGVDSLLDQALTQTMHGPRAPIFLDLFKALMKGDEMRYAFVTNDWREAIRIGAKYATDEVMIKAISWLLPQLASLVSIAKLCALPEILTLDAIIDSADTLAINNQIKLYNYARQLGYNHERIMSGASNDDIYFERGWIWVIVALGDITRPGIPLKLTPEQVYGFAGMQYAIKNEIDYYERNKAAIGEEFLKLIQPNITYTPSEPTAPSDIEFSVSGSQVTGMNIISYDWNFGDAQTGTGSPVIHYYKKPGIYPVSLVMTDNAGKIHPYNTTVVVKPPQINVSHPDGYSSLTRKFSTPDSSRYKHYNWDFGYNTPQGNDRESFNTYPPESRYYTVTLTVTLQDDTPIQAQTGIFVGPGTRYIQGHTIYGEETWYSGGTYEVQGTITVAQGGRLTIEPGTTVKFNCPNCSYINVNGTLTATDASFAWADGQSERYSIYFDGAGANNSRLDGCILENASAYYDIGIIRISNSSPTITGCTIKGSIANNGIKIESGSPVIINNTISGMTNYGLSINSASSPTVTNNRFTGNKYGIYIDYGPNNPVIGGNIYSGNSQADIYAWGTINTAVTWGNEWGDNVFQIGNLDIAKDASLTIRPSKMVKSIYSVWVHGTLTATDVKFTWAETDHPWRNIIFIGSDASNSRLENCVIEHALGYIPCWDCHGYPGIIAIDDSSPTITGCTIKNCVANHGIWIEDSSSPVITNNIISGMTQHGLYIFHNSSPTVTGNTISDNQSGIVMRNEYGTNTEISGTYQGNTISGNEIGFSIIYGSNNLVITGNKYTNNSMADIYAGGTINTSVTWGDEEGDNVFRADYLKIAKDARLTINPGKTVKVGGGGSIIVMGTLTTKDVKFTWADGTSQWRGIWFLWDGASNSRLENSILEHASADSDYLPHSIIQITNSSPTVTGCTINNCASNHGIEIEDSSPIITNNTISGMTRDGLFIHTNSSPTVTGNTISDNNYGINISSDCSGTYQNNKFSGNTEYAIFYSGTPIIDATHCDWGDPSGPLDSSDDRATGGWYNPGGLGNKVSDHVNYTPWGIIVPIPGDINHDGKMDLADAVLALQIMAGTVPVRPVFPDADVNNDSRIGTEEVIYIFQKVSGQR
jgi:parallel beta-helix repeat protein